MLSVAAAQNPARAGAAALKTALSLLGTYTLVRAMARAHHGARPLLWTLVFGVTGVLIHAAVQMVQGHLPIALFDSPLKLGSFLAMTVTLIASYLTAQGRVWLSIWAALLAAGGLLLSGSLWAWAGIVVGLAAGAAADAKAQIWLAGAMIAAATVMGWLTSCGKHHQLIEDTQWREDGGQDLRQRYIEWQALINLLKDHSAVGTGVGCLNDRRSEYYLRLPKNNTIAAFDQNGYLAAAAEAGMPGLAVMCWILAEYLQKGWRRRREPVARAAWVGLVAVAIAQVGSSLTFSGILVVFAILLALIDNSEQEVTHALA
jgi:O-antigen ligase